MRGTGRSEECPTLCPAETSGTQKTRKNKTAKRRLPPEKNKIKVISAC